MENKEENLFIQVIIPVYNSEKTLRKCLDSLINQTYKNWQAIIIDDASNDSGVNIIEEYINADSRFYLIKKDENAGAADSRNKGLEILDSDYAAFLDSDDYWEPDMLKKMVDKAKEYDCDVVQCRFIYDFPNGKKVLPKGAFKEDVFLENKMLKKVFIKMMTGINMNHVCMKLIRTSLIRNIRFDTSLRTAEDLEFSIKLFSNVKKYYFLNEVFYHYVRNQESLTGRGLSFSEKLQANRKVSKRMLEALPLWNMNKFYYKIMSLMRPYVIIISKIFRIIREKILG